MVAHQLSLRRRKQEWTLLVSSVAVLVALGGCRGGGGDGGVANPATTTLAAEPTTSAPSTPTTGAMSRERADVRLAFEAASRAFNDAAAIPDPRFPALLATHTGPMLEQRREVLLALKADGRVIRYPANSKYRIVIRSIELEGDIARVTFCAVDDGERVVASTGEVVSRGVVTVEGRAALRLDGAWKLAEQQFDSREEGREAC